MFRSKKTLKSETVKFGSTDRKEGVSLEVAKGVFSVVTRFGSYVTKDKSEADAIFRGAVIDLRTGSR